MWFPLSSKHKQIDFLQSCRFTVEAEDVSVCVTQQCLLRVRPQENMHCNVQTARRLSLWQRHTSQFVRVILAQGHARSLCKPQYVTKEGALGHLLRSARAMLIFSVSFQFYRMHPE
eukprot:6464890-Amphidinium_carterae.2